MNGQRTAYTNSLPSTTLDCSHIQATSDSLAADEGLEAIHGVLEPSLELYGALVAHGVNPRRRPWAQRLVENFSTLNELRWISWRRLMHVVGMGARAVLEAAEGGGSVGEHAGVHDQVLLYTSRHPGKISVFVRVRWGE